MIILDTVKSVEEAIKCNKLLTKLILSESKYNENINMNYTVEKWFENVYDKEYNKIFVAKDGEKIVGYAYCKINWIENGPAKELEALLDGIYVEESYRKQGIATKLLNTAKQWAKDNKVKYLTINVMEANTEALKLYYKSGFNDFEKCLRMNISYGNTNDSFYSSDNIERLKRVIKDVDNGKVTEHIMLQDIKDTCHYVSENSKHVKIDNENLKKFVNHMTNVKLDSWLSSSPFGLLELDTKTIINFLLVYESIDFSFWGNPKWAIETDNGSLDGGSALMYCMIKYIKKNDGKITDISEDEFSKMLKGNVEIPLLHERYLIINQINKIVNEKMDGNFYECIKNLNADIELFDFLVKTFPFLKDERTYKNKRIYFYKLAQLLTSDILHIREIKENARVDYSHLVGCADYKIPQVLRGLDILLYDDELSKMIDSKTELVENSEFEVEIRANMIEVISRINTMLDNKYNQIDINDYIFIQKKNKNLTNKPYHLTRTTNY